MLISYFSIKHASIYSVLCLAKIFTGTSSGETKISDFVMMLAPLMQRIATTWSDIVSSIAKESNKVRKSKGDVPFGIHALGARLLVDHEGYYKNRHHAV